MSAMPSVATDLAEASGPAGDSSTTLDREALGRIRDRLVRPMPTDRLWGWLLPLAITLLAGVARFWRITRPGGHTLTSPNGIIFDETYYAHDSWSLLHHGVETNGPMTAPGFVVHPPLGKWLMALGEALVDHGKTVTFHHTIYPASPLSFRFSGAVLGTLAVLLTARIGRRLFRSTALGSIAGLLVALDGMEFVQSRTAMLDIYLMFWVLAAFGCLVVDRDDGRRRLSARLTAPLGPDDRAPALGFRPWRWGAGLCLGISMATKWDGAFWLPVLLVLAIVWDATARRTAGSARAIGRQDIEGAGFALAAFVALPFIVYVGSWTGWFLSDGHYAYNHDKFIHPGQSWIGHDWSVFRGWLDYQKAIWHYSNTLTWDQNPHPYLSRPWGWMLLARPVAYFYATPTTCGASACAQEVLSVGNPALWWAAILGLLAAAWTWVARRDWRGGAIVAMFAIGYLPWFREDTKHRVMFLFYMLPDVPFMALAVAMALGLLAGRRAASDTRRGVGLGVIAVYLAAVAVTFGFLYPVLSGQTLTYDKWHERILFRHCAIHPNTHHENAPCWI
jgi:dolichyl-phosphate-mannose--protein O-mannosyl transferase